MKFKATLNVSHENTYYMLFHHFKNDNKVAAFLFDHFLMSGKAMLEAGSELAAEELAEQAQPEETVGV